MSDDYIEGGSVQVEHTSWGSRLMNSIKGVVFGALLFLVSFVILFLNEGRAVKTAKSLKEGLGVVQSVNKWDSANESKLIHITGELHTDEMLVDDVFNIKANGIRLRRSVLMFQVEESFETKTRKKLGGGEEKIKVPRYREVWSSSHIDSSRFADDNFRNINPNMPYHSFMVDASKVTLDEFTLTQSLIKNVDRFETIPITKEILEGLPTNDFQAYEQTLYSGDPQTPRIGDLKISFSVVKPCVVSIISQQKDKTFTPYQTEAGRQIEMLKVGKYDYQEMFQQALESNATVTWILRFVGFVLMGLGIALIFNPLVVFADVLPFLGNLLGLGIFLFAMVLSLVLSLITISIAWLFYRPLFAAVLIAVSIGILVVFMRKRKTAVSG